MLRKVINLFRKLRIGMLHATYHKNMKLAEKAREDHDIVTFKKYIYRAEDAWRKLVIITNKIHN